MKVERIFEGMRHGHLTVTHEVERDRRSIRRFECRCDCGELVVLRSNHFYPSRLYCTRKCPFLSEKRTVDLTGKLFGRWTVLKRGPKNHRCFLWDCVCACGTKRILPGEMLTAGGSQSCGCIVKDRIIQRSPEERLELYRLRSRLSNRKNPARVKANKIQYERKLAKATPAWLTEDDWRVMNALYKKARELTRETGIRHEVDHILPIKGETVSGLHVPLNLQILTQAVNVAKSNRYAELPGDR